ncbi:MAG: HXXEE domain-containing protein [Candidatus Levybacteria bacterium]|nr:HXXEE domain-containing protein [Candidatus Levybacteria bacterium]
MINLETFALVILIVQIAHSIEELATGFHKRWYLRKLSFNTFLLFEIVHNIFWISVVLFKEFPLRSELLFFFIALMFANGVQHLVWFGTEKKYVPGLITAPIHVVLFLLFFFQFVKFV